MSKVTAVFFSPTGGSRRSVMSMSETLSGGEYATIDLTPVQTPPIQHFGKDDFVVFGVPCYKGRIPVLAAQRLSALYGTETPCIISVTYGNRDYDDALLELHDLVTAQGFHPEGAAALVGRHTFGEIQLDRPNSKDAMENSYFAEQVLARMRRGEEPFLHIPGERPYRGEGTGAGFIPLTSESCINCGLCVKECPAGAIADDCRTIDGSKCLSCFRCIRFCPRQAKHMNVEPYLSFAHDFSIKLSTRRDNEYFL